MVDGVLIPTEGNIGFLDVVCFSGDTLIETLRGEVRAADLKPGDMVRTVDNGLKPVLWLGIARLSKTRLAASPKLQPIRIRQGALAADVPKRDLLVSPQHRVLFSSPVAQNMFGEREVLIAAKKLVGLPGIEIAEEVEWIDYVHFIFDQHELVFSEGARTESMFTGTEALKMVPAEARAELLELFPDWGGNDAQPARKIIHGRDIRKLLQRHTARALRHGETGQGLVV